MEAVPDKTPASIKHPTSKAPFKDNPEGTEAGTINNVQKQIETLRRRQLNEGDAEQRAETHRKGGEAILVTRRWQRTPKWRWHSRCAAEDRST